MENCVFCKLAKGEVEDLRVWEDENFVAFLDINPFVRGHTLIIPKKHTRWVWDLGEKEYLNYLLAVKNLANILKKAFGTECVQLIIAGMDVPHTHIHLLPRLENDGIPAVPKIPLDPKPSEGEMKEIVEKIKVALESADYSHLPFCNLYFELN
jgi:histidine triad (HIT) family protein